MKERTELPIHGARTMETKSLLHSLQIDCSSYVDLVVLTGLQNQYLKARQIELPRRLSRTSLRYFSQCLKGAAPPFLVLKTHLTKMISEDKIHLFWSAIRVFPELRSWKKRSTEERVIRQPASSGILYPLTFLITQVDHRVFTFYLSIYIPFSL